MYISVVIPLYNKEKSIQSTLKSILSQTFHEFEIVVIDDGSTDRSADIVNAISDSRVRLIRKENGGVCSARNRGILEAKYDYVAFLDADDIWDENYLREQVKMINDYPNAKMWGINFAETSNSELVRYLPTGLSENFRGYIDDYFNIKGRISDLFCSSSVVVKRDVFDKVGFFDERIRYAEDNDMWFRIIASFPIAFYDKYMVFYQFDAENRALNKEIPLISYLPYYNDKYTTYKGTYFYMWIQRWCAVKLKKYYFNIPKERINAKYAIRKLDYSVIPHKYLLLFKTPYLIGKFFYLLDNAYHKYVRKYNTNNNI